MVFSSLTIGIPDATDSPARARHHAHGTDRRTIRPHPCPANLGAVPPAGYDPDMAIRTLICLLTFACLSTAQTPEIDMAFFKAYYLEHREKSHEEARALYDAYLKKAPRGRHAAQAELGLQRIKSANPTTPGAAAHTQSIKIPRDTRMFGQRRIARMEKMENAAKAGGRFLQAARLRTRQCYLSVVSNAAAGMASDDQKLVQLVSQRNTHLAFKNEERAGEVTRQIAALVAKRNFRTQYHAVRAAMMARAKADAKMNGADPDSSFCVFLCDLSQGIDLAWPEQIARFRTWLGDTAARPDADASEVETAQAISIDAGKALALIDGGKRKEAQAIIDQIWNWSVIQ